MEERMPLQQSYLRKHSWGLKWYTVPVMHCSIYLFVTISFLNIFNFACCILPSLDCLLFIVVLFSHAFHFLFSFLVPNSFSKNSGFHQKFLTKDRKSRSRVGTQGVFVWFGLIWFNLIFSISFNWQLELLLFYLLM